MLFTALLIANDAQMVPYIIIFERIFSIVLFNHEDFRIQVTRLTKSRLANDDPNAQNFSACHLLLLDVSGPYFLLVTFFPAESTNL